MENIQEYIKPELLVVIPVLYIIGLIIKNTERISDRWIPTILSAFGVLLCAIYVLATSDFSLLAIFISFTQGILVTGVAVYVNQMIKQIGEKK